MKAVIKALLKLVAAKVVKKYKPQIIGITGSVGKTSTKEAVYAVLQAKFKNKVVKSIKNYNNELGLPLTILRVESGNRSLVRWLAILGVGLKLLFKKNPDYPEIFVLEMGADKVGDIAYLLRIAPCNVGILTVIGPTHLQFFSTIENIVKEKSQIINRLPPNGLALINIDDPLVAALRSKTRAHALTYGFNPEADIRASDLVISQALDNSLERVGRIKGVSFKLTQGGSSVPFHLPKVLGVQHVYAALAAAGVGLKFGMNLIEMAEALKNYKAAPGRMNLIAGIKKSLIIDDSYNAAPASGIAALEAMSRIDLPKPSEKFAILGDMAELGSQSEEGHLQVGQKVFESGVNYLITIGEKARDIARGARQAGMPEANVYQFAKIEEAAKFAQNRLEKGDLILIKGSQSARMEKIVKELMADPLLAEMLLVRQGPEWVNKP